MLPETKKKFYHAITLDTCYLLSIPKMDFDHIMRDVERKAVNERILFIKTIPELNVNISRHKLINLCKHLIPVNMIKNQTLYKEGDETRFVYFVKAGELKLSKKILLVKGAGGTEQHPSKATQSKTNRDACEVRNHVVGFVTKG